MDSYKRFKDEDYKNWLKTAESLYILRSNIRDFVENETETYHKSLQKCIKGEACVDKCSLKKYVRGKFPICDKCERWIDEIFHGPVAKGTQIHWSNCEPYRWPTEKWEVAKVFMPRGQKDHRSFDQFDISAILNFMTHCKHFKKFVKDKHLTKVISVRNNVMHSPDFKLNKENMSKSLQDVLNLAKHLEEHIPNLHQTISEEINQYETVLENYPGQVGGNSENIQLLDREQQALKDKIEFLTQCYEADQHAEIKEELLGMKNFLDQNKDLLENLRPQVNRLNEIQDRVDKHETQIDNLSNRVDGLEKVTQDPMFSGDPLKFKNHLIEEAGKRKWPDPIFSEEHEASGYRGRVEVNGRIFEGSQVCNKKRFAHQEVAKKALYWLKEDFESTEEPSTPVTSSTSSTSTLFYGTVMVDINKEVCSDGHEKEEEAIESAYRKLLGQFGLINLDGNHTFKTAVLEHFNNYGVQQPVESISKLNDKIFCQVELRGTFPFHDKDGSTTKKKAEQQAAKVALDKLSGFLNCSFMADTEENYKVFLKERLDALGMKNPFYRADKEKVSDEALGPSTNRDHLHVSSMQTNPDKPTNRPQESITIVQCTPSASSPSPISRESEVDKEDYTVSSTQTRLHEPENCSLQPKDSVVVVPATHSDCAAVTVIKETQDSSTSPVPREVDMTGYTEISNFLELYLLKPPSVTVEHVKTEKKFNLVMDITLDNFTFQNSNVYTSKKVATRKTYCLLGRALGICNPTTDENVTMLVKQDFSQKSLPLPNEDCTNISNGFSCCLTGIKYNLIIEGQAPTEAEAKFDALQKALCSLPLLFGYEALPRSGSAKENEDQINALLQKAGQKDLAFSLRPSHHKISINLRFKDYTMESRSQKNKKENRNLLSKRILGLLGVEPEPQCPSLRNRLDDWFKQKNLQQPVFDDTEEVQGSKATFSAEQLCTHPNWEDSLETAKKMLVQELKIRFKYLTDSPQED